MAYTRTVGDLTGSVREDGDYDSSNPSGGALDGGYLMRKLSRNYRESYELLAQADPDRLTTTSVYTTVASSSTGSVPLPTDLYRLRAVDVKVANQWLRLIRDDPSPLNSPWELPFGTALPGLTGVPARYRVEGSYAYVAPDVPANTQFRFTYIPDAVALTGSDQVVTCAAGEDELACWMTVRDIRGREERDVSEAERNIARLTKRIADMASQRDSGQPKRLEDPLTSRVGRLWRRGSFR